jgi:hypothetical protein
VFLAARSVAGISKISFHESGVYRFAVVSKTPRPAIVSWKRPKETADGVTPIFSIIVPAILVKDRFRDLIPDANKPTLFLTPPEINSKIIISIFLAKSDFTESDFRKIPSDRPLSFHGAVDLQREAAGLVSYYDKFVISEQKDMMKLIRDTKIHLNPEGTKDGIAFAHLHVFEKQEPPLIIDLQLGEGNLDIPTQ